MKTSILVVGQRVHSILYGGRDGAIFNIRGTQKPETIGSMGGVICFGGAASFDIVFENGTEALDIPESIVRGVQWRIFDEVISPDDIASMRGFAILEANRKADEKSAAAAAFRAAVEKLRADPELKHLKQTGPDCHGSATLAAANIRAELKRAFPGVKFSVRSKSFSGGDDIRVAWVDGPPTPKVEEIAGKYKAGSFDGMEDIYNYSRCPWTEVFGDSKYIFCERSHSFEAMKSAVFQIAEEFGWELLKVETNSDGTGYLPYNCDERFRREVYLHLGETRG